MITLEVGQKYRTRDGDIVVKIEIIDTARPNPYVGIVLSCKDRYFRELDIFEYKSNGRFNYY